VLAHVQWSDLVKRRLEWIVLGWIVGVTTIVQADVKTVTVSHSTLTGIGAEEGVMRRDPSDVIKVVDLM
jgi:hypothetical protein